MNTNLNRAKANKNDEYYTPYEEVVRGVTPFKSQFRNAIVYCNCDDERSTFYQFFKENFGALHLKNLIASGIHINYAIQFNGVEETKIPLKGYGDYKSPELLPFVRGCDIICTNPPFSIFREYFDFLYLSHKRFLVIAPLTSITYKAVYPFILNRNVTPLLTKSLKFLNDKAVPITWLTNMDYPTPAPLDTGVRYVSGAYDFCDDMPSVINVNKVKQIPMDYDGVMAVPITFLYSWNPRQFEILDRPVARPIVNEKTKFDRILIRRI